MKTSCDGSSSWFCTDCGGKNIGEATFCTECGTKKEPTTPQTVAPLGSPPVLPSPFIHLYFSKNGGAAAELHLLVKYAYRLKDQDETIGLRLHPMGVNSPAEIFDTDHIDLADDAKVSATAPASARYGNLPAFLATAGARGLERVIRDRLPEALAVRVLVDPPTESESWLGESRDDFAARLVAGGARLRVELAKRNLQFREATRSIAARAQPKSFFGGLFGGAAATTPSEQRMKDAADARVAELQQEITVIEAKIASVGDVHPARFAEKTLIPAKAAVKLLRYDLVWVY